MRPKTCGCCGDCGIRFIVCPYTVLSWRSGTVAKANKRKKNNNTSYLKSESCVKMSKALQVKAHFDATLRFRLPPPVLTSQDAPELHLTITPLQKPRAPPPAWAYSVKLSAMEWHCHISVPELLKAFIASWGRDVMQGWLIAVKCDRLGSQSPFL